MQSLVYSNSPDEQVPTRIGKVNRFREEQFWAFLQFDQKQYIYFSSNMNSFDGTQTTEKLRISQSNAVLYSL